jgi:hypothetical protein
MKTIMRRKITFIPANKRDIEFKLLKNNCIDRNVRIVAEVAIVANGVAATEI